MFKKLLIVSIVSLSIIFFSTPILSPMDTNSRMGTMAVAGTFSEMRSETIAITLTVPDGGETWRAGTTQTIRWTYAGSPILRSKVKIELLKGGEVNRIISSAASIGRNGSGSYNWRIPSNQSSGSDYRIRITITSNASLTDVSANDFSISSLSAANTVIGTWEITATGTVKVNIPGYPPRTQPMHVQDEFIFYPNETFEMTDAGGTWSQNGKTFNVLLDSNDIASLLETMIGDYLGDTQIDIQQNMLSGTVSTNAINGKWSLKIGMSFLDLGLQGNATVSVSFRGTRSSGGAISSLDEEDSSTLSESFMEVIGKNLQNLIQRYSPVSSH